uniref:Uncharacterized protein n=1 Tax=Cacopsylla melanoneura TaxID=428564 RepID=A0A8D8PZ65_9HEMI
MARLCTHPMNYDITFFSPFNKLFIFPSNIILIHSPPISSLFLSISPSLSPLFLPLYLPSPNTHFYLNRTYVEIARLKASSQIYLVSVYILSLSLSLFPPCTFLFSGSNITLTGKNIIVGTKTVLYAHLRLHAAKSAKQEYLNWISDW